LMIEDMAINKENMLKMASMDYSCATDLADWLVQKLNLPFRQCHHLTGAIVKMAEEKNLDLHQLKLSDMQKIEPRITKEIFNFLDVKNSVKSRNSYGGTSPYQVKLQIETAKKYLKSFKK
ncbi:MAG: argininosuccinate lyase, partial [Alphaproteobacteria bacterium]